MNVLIIAAHGSRKRASAQEVAALASRIESKASGFDKTCHAFLQFAQPSLSEAIDTAVADGAAHIVVFPFFIATGSHVQTDIPDQVDAAAKKHPKVRFSITRHLGVIESVEDLVIGEVRNHVEREAD